MTLLSLPSLSFLLSCCFSPGVAITILNPSIRSNDGCVGERKEPGKLITLWGNLRNSRSPGLPGYKDLPIPLRVVCFWQ